MLSRPSRVVLFGGSHYEVDLTGAHLAIVLAHPIGKRFDEHRPAMVYAHLAQGCQNKAKRIKTALQQVGSIGHDAMLTRFSRLNITVTLRIAHFIRDIYSKRNAILEQLKGSRFEPRGQFVNPGNVHSHLLSILETYFMLHALSHLAASGPIESIVWVHDAFILHNSISHERAAAAFEHAAKMSHLPPLPYKLNAVT